MIRSLRVVDFRCFESLALEVPEGGGVFTGDNAQGKTSILEAVCLLVRLHSPRSHRMSTMAQVGGPGGFGIAGEAWKAERKIRWQRRTAMDFAVDGESRSSHGDYLADVDVERDAVKRMVMVVEHGYAAAFKHRHSRCRRG